jgi:hypothetical protein
MVKRQFGTQESSGGPEAGLERGGKYLTEGGRKNWRIVGFIALVGFITFNTVGVYSWAQKDEADQVDASETVVGFEIPDYYEDGSLKSVLRAGVAVIQAKKQLVDINDLTINFYDKKTREVEMVVTAPKCLYSTGRKRAVSDEAVLIKRDNITVSGVGFEWVDNVEKKEFTIQSKARVELRNMDKSALEGKKDDAEK